LFPVGDEVHELGYRHMFTDMLDSMEQGTVPEETFYDGYIVNAIMDAAYLSTQTKKWEPVMLEVWRGKASAEKDNLFRDYDEYHYLIKEELTHYGTVKVILKNKLTGDIIEQERPAEKR